MTDTPKRQEPASYQLRVAGHLDQHWSAWFGDLILAHEADGTTSLTGAIADQAALHGLLVKIRDLGVTLISLTVVDRQGDHRYQGSRASLPTVARASSSASAFGPSASG